MTTVAHRSTTVRHLIDGAWSAPDGETSSADVERALTAAWSAHRTGMPLDARVTALRAAADTLDAVSEDIAVQDTADSGVPVAVTRLFAGSFGDTLRGAADRVASLAPESLDADGRIVRLHRLPLGPAVVLAPWNAPTAVAAKKTAFAWAAGCPVLVKPSPFSPHGTVLLVEALAGAAADAGLPVGAVQLVLGGAETGQQLVRSRHTRAVSFTGSRSGGRAVAAAAAAEVAACQLELGSNNPAVVLADADLAVTARALASGMTKLNGAWCESPGTVFVPAAKRAALLTALTAELGRLVAGDPFHDATTFGPQAFVGQADEVRRRLAELVRAGADVVTVGTVPDDARWVPPTLVVDPPPDLVRDEIFGPVLVLRTCDDPDDAVEQSSALATGLAGYVFTSDVERGLTLGARLPVGEVKLNGSSLLDMSDRSSQAFWYGSGVGGHGDAELLRFFTGARIVGEDVDAPI